MPVATDDPTHTSVTASVGNYSITGQTSGQNVPGISHASVLINSHLYTLKTLVRSTQLPVSIQFFILLSILYYALHVTWDLNGATKVANFIFASLLLIVYRSALFLFMLMFSKIYYQPP